MSGTRKATLLSSCTFLYFTKRHLHFLPKPLCHQQSRQRSTPTEHPPHIQRCYSLEKLRYIRSNWKFNTSHFTSSTNYPSSASFIFKMSNLGGCRLVSWYWLCRGLCFEQVRGLLLRQSYSKWKPSANYTIACRLKLENEGAEFFYMQVH